MVEGVDCAVGGLRRSLHPCSCRDLNVSVSRLGIYSISFCSVLHTCLFHPKQLLPSAWSPPAGIAVASIVPFAPVVGGAAILGGRSIWRRRLQEGVFRP